MNDIEKYLEDAIPPRYIGAKWEDVPEKIRDTFTSMKIGGKGVFIHGESGTGKTHIAYALFRHRTEQHKSTWLINTVQLFKDLRDDVIRSPSEKTHYMNKIMAYEGLLVFDDIGVEKATDFVLESFYLIINEKYNQMRPMVFTSNMSLGQIAMNLNDRIASRIAEMCEIVKMKGKDQRLK